ncbi:hypothetical protein HOG48_01265 [Candidatus Peregrinibacteria bacterium]|jgi:hypothetical protein|nr:hypothetical protein [Candidatus Peregrinibacteria bacterium]
MTAERRPKSRAEGRLTTADMKKLSPLVALALALAAGAVLIFTGVVRERIKEGVFCIEGFTQIQDPKSGDLVGIEVKTTSGLTFVVARELLEDLSQIPENDTHWMFAYDPSGIDCLSFNANNCFEAVSLGFEEEYCREVPFL